MNEDWKCDYCHESLELGSQNWASYNLIQNGKKKQIRLHDGDCTEKYLEKLKEDNSSGN